MTRFKRILQFLLSCRSWTGRFGLVLLLTFVAVSALLLSCGSPRLGPELSAQSYAEFETRGLLINIVRDTSTVWGSWEDRGDRLFGLVEGRADGEGNLALRLYTGGGASSPALLEGRFVEGGRAIQADYRASELGSPRRLILGKLGELGKGLRLERSEASDDRASRDPEPRRIFSAVAFEPSGPAALRGWYRRQFEGGRELGRVLADERDAFLTSWRRAAETRVVDGEEGSASAWSYDSRQFILYRSTSLLSWGRRLSTYTGGVHGRVDTEFSTVDLKAMRVLGLDDILYGNWRTGLEEELGPALRRVLGLDPGASLVDAGFFEERLRPGEEFALCSSGLAFYYGPGEIASADLGEFWVFLDWEELEVYLRRGFLEGQGVPLPPERGGIG